MSCRPVAAPQPPHPPGRQAGPRRWAPQGQHCRCHGPCLPHTAQVRLQQPTLPCWVPRPVVTLPRTDHGGTQPRHVALGTAAGTVPGHVEGQSLPTSWSWAPPCSPRSLQPAVRPAGLWVLCCQAPGWQSWRPVPPARTREQVLVSEEMKDRDPLPWHQPRPAHPADGGRQASASALGTRDLAPHTPPPLSVQTGGGRSCGRRGHSSPSSLGLPHCLPSRLQWSRSGEAGRSSQGPLSCLLRELSSAPPSPSARPHLAALASGSTLTGP